METRYLGRSVLKVSVLQLGTMTFGGGGAFAKVGNTDLDSASRQIGLALDAGVNMIDTADVYSAGLSEDIVGQALAGRREEVLLATKVRFPMGAGANDEGLSRHHIMRACEASLKRLRTDYIDLYWCHEWDGMTPVEETLQAMDDLRSAGKIRYMGISNFSGWHAMKMLAAANRHHLISPVAQQIYYSLQSRDAEQELLPVGVDQDLGGVIWSPLAGGLLSGKHRRDQAVPEGSRQAAQWDEPPVYDVDALYDIVEALIEVSASYEGATPAQVALAWSLSRAGVSSLIVGARNDAQLIDNLKAVELTLDEDSLARLEQVSRPPLRYPYWHQRKTAHRRLSAADRVLLGPYLSH